LVAVAFFLHGQAKDLSAPSRTITSVFQFLVTLFATRILFFLHY